MVLVGYWPLNESSKDPDNPTAKDHSGNKNHGTIYDGGDSTVPGASGVLGQNAYSFDGSNDYVDTSSPNILSSKNSLTLSAWVRTDSIPSGYPGIVVGQPDAGNQVGMFQHEGNFYYEVGTSDGSQNKIDPGEPVTLGEWIHICLTFKNSKMIEFINGSYTGRSNNTSERTTDTMNDMNIGRWSGGPDHFDGKIAEVRIYNHALTPAEIQYLYQVGNRGRQVTSVKKS